jgi:hypothetical protein
VVTPIATSSCLNRLIGRIVCSTVLQISVGDTITNEPEALIQAAVAISTACMACSTAVPFPGRSRFSCESDSGPKEAGSRPGRFISASIAGSTLLTRERRVRVTDIYRLPMSSQIAITRWRFTVNRSTDHLS